MERVAVMADRNSKLLVVALLLATLPVVARGQTPPLPALPVQVQSAPPDLPPVTIGSPQAPQPPLPPPAGPPPSPAFGIGVNPPPPGFGIGVNPAPPIIPPGPLFIQGQPPTTPGLFDGIPFVGVQFDFVKPVATEHLQGTFPLNNGTAITLQPPSHSLDWTVSPKLELGWHMPENRGDIVVSYRFLATDGNGAFTNPAGDFGVKSRLDINLFDVDYVSFPEEFAPRWFVRYRLGARVTATYYDTTASGALLTEKVSNNFIGAGPKGGLEVSRQIGLLPAFSLFARADAAVMVGQITQKFYETIDNDPSNPLSGTIKTNRTQSVPTFSLSAGVNYTPPAADYLHFSLGYEWERWWSLGRSGDARLDLTTNSFFIRGQFDF